MVQDKANGTIKDFTVTPVKRALLAVSYYLATIFSTLIICFVAAGLCMGYMALKGWYMTFADVLLLLLDVILLVMFGTALSSIINFFLSTQGQLSAVGTIVSAGYGFICGAYMPISQFSEGLQKFISFLPGTYGTSLMRNHAMRGVLKEMVKSGIPSEAVDGLKDAVDCNLYFFDNKVGIGEMYAVLCGSVIILAVMYVLMNVFLLKRKRKA